jgi:hypothetical protein
MFRVVGVYITPIMKSLIIVLLFILSLPALRSEDPSQALKHFREIRKAGKFLVKHGADRGVVRHIAQNHVVNRVEKRIEQAKHRRRHFVNANVNSNSNSNSNDNTNDNNSSASVVDNSVILPEFDLQGYVDWKRYQDERNQKTQKGAPISPLDSRATAPASVTPPASDPQSRYNAFLRSKGISPNTIGNATIVAGKMFVPTVEEQYAIRNSNMAAQLANAQEEPEIEAIANR